MRQREHELVVARKHVVFGDVNRIGPSVQVRRGGAVVGDLPRDAERFVTGTHRIGDDTGDLQVGRRSQQHVDWSRSVVAAFQVVGRVGIDVVLEGCLEDSLIAVGVNREEELTRQASRNVDRRFGFVEITDFQDAVVAKGSDQSIATPRSWSVGTERQPNLVCPVAGIRGASSVVRDLVANGDGGIVKRIARAVDEIDNQIGRRYGNRVDGNRGRGDVVTLD